MRYRLLQQLNVSRGLSSRPLKLKEACEVLELRCHCFGVIFEFSFCALGTRRAAKNQITVLGRHFLHTQGFTGQWSRLSRLRSLGWSFCGVWAAWANSVLCFIRLLSRVSYSLIFMGKHLLLLSWVALFSLAHKI